MSFQLEAEIKALLEEHRDPEMVAESLIHDFQNSFLENPTSKVHKESLAELCRYLNIAGLHQVLIRLCLRHVTNPLFPLPWHFFVEALTKSKAMIEPEVKELIRAGIDHEQASAQVALAQGAHHFIDDPASFKASAKKQRVQILADLRKRLRDEVLTLRTQQLYDQEKARLIQLLKIFPGDPEITVDLKNHKERRALDVLSRHSPLSRSARSQKASLQTETLDIGEALKESFEENLSSSPSMAFDFAMAAYMMDDFETCAQLLNSAELSLPQTWFHLEVKLKCRRFLEVLQDLNDLEMKLAADPETFFATAYLRAQAFWGLGQKHTAIEVLESLLSVRPHYRAGATLLDLWRSE